MNFCTSLRNPIKNTTFVLRKCKFLLQSSKAKQRQANHRNTLRCISSIKGRREIHSFEIFETNANVDRRIAAQYASRVIRHCASIYAAK